MLASVVYYFLLCFPEVQTLLNVSQFEMEKVCLVVAFVAVLVLCFIVHVHGNAGRKFVYGCSSYTFHAPFSHKAGYNWQESRQFCKETGSDLVSIESLEEWDILRSAIQNMKTAEYFIGLRLIDEHPRKWRWLSKNTPMNASRGIHPWAPSQPSGDGKCAVMYKEYNKFFGRFNDVGCTVILRNAGYICERPVTECNNIEEPSTEPPRTKASSKQSSTKPASAQTLLVTAVTPLSMQQRSGTDEPVTFQRKSSTGLTILQNIHSTISTQRKYDKDLSTEIFTSQPETDSRDPANDLPAVKPAKSSRTLIMIVLPLLVVIILVSLIALWLFCVRPRQSHKMKGSSSKPQSPGDEQHLESSTELSVSVGISQPAESLDSYNTVEEGKQEHINVIVEKRNEGAVNEMQLDDGYPVPTKKFGSCESSSKDKTKMKDCAYAVVHIRPGQGKSSLCKHSTAVPRERLEDTSTPKRCSKDGRPTELVNLSTFGHAKEMTDSEPGTGENPHSREEFKDYLKAVVDKANKKRKPPKKPAPYRNIVYAHLSHSTDINTGRINRANLPTVYADIDYLKTGASESGPQEEKEAQTKEGDNDL